MKGQHPTVTGRWCDRWVSRPSVRFRCTLERMLDVWLLDVSQSASRDSTIMAFTQHSCKNYR